MTTQATPDIKPISQLTNHPRLHVGPDDWARLADTQQDPWFADYVSSTTTLADEGLDCDATMANFKEEGHNWHLVRARRVQMITWSQIVAYRMTGEAKYKDAVMSYVKLMRDWEYWSWIAWRAGVNDSSQLFDLSFGENCTTLAAINDWLWEDLTDDDKALILQTARRPIDCMMTYLTPKADGSMPAKPWWFGQPNSNWNTVCAGGSGMLALSLFEALPEAQRVIDAAEASIMPYMKELEKINGAWPEGIGYWNYGMRYAFMYLLSHEQATGSKHWALEQDATRQSLYFPIEFCPNGVPCSFGDVNQWAPLPFHQAVARRVGADALAAELFRMYPTLSPGTARRTTWPNAAETLLLLMKPPGKSSEAAATKDTADGPFVHLYQGQDWGIIADRAHQPELYMTVRGGTTEVPHGHLDLTSFHAGVRDEKVIQSQGVNEYLDTTFSPRRYDLYDTTPASKNVVLISGAGIMKPSRVVTREIRLNSDAVGLNIDATLAMGPSRDKPAVESYHRSYLMIDRKALLVLDNVILPFDGKFESRLHTPMSITLPQEVSSDVARTFCEIQLTGERQKAQLHLASSAPSKLYLAESLSTSPVKPVHVIRWIGATLSKQMAFATLIMAAGDTHESTGDAPRVSLTAHADGVDVELNLPWGQKTFKLTADLAAIR